MSKHSTGDLVIKKREGDTTKKPKKNRFFVVFHPYYILIISSACKNVNYVSRETSPFLLYLHFVQKALPLFFSVTAPAMLFRRPAPRASTPSLPFLPGSTILPCAFRLLYPFLAYLRPLSAVFTRIHHFALHFPFFCISSLLI